MRVNLAVNIPMRIISTWLFDPWFDGDTQGWRHTVDMLAAMRAAVSLAQQRCGEITVYTNSRSRPWLQMILPEVRIEVTHDQAHESVPAQFYSWCKLWTWRLQTQEFLHIDLDFLLGPKWLLPSDSTMLLGQWWEDVLDPRARGFYDWHSRSSNLSLPANLQHIDPNAPALNTGCFMARDPDFVRDYVDTVESLVTNNPGPALCLGVPTLEQHVLGMMIRQRGLDCQVLIPPMQKYMPVNNQFIHLLGRRWKNRDLPLAASVLSAVLDSWIDDDLRALARRLDAQRDRNIKA